MRSALLLLSALWLLAGCDNQQQDLYAVSHPLLYIESDWQPTLHKADMSQNATALFYRDGQVAAKEYFFKPNSITTKVTAGQYDILLFNGLMYTPEQTHLDDIFFRGTDRIETFEACAKEVTPSKRLLKQDGEYLASTEMEALTAYRLQFDVKGDNSYYAKYHDGRKTGLEITDYIEDSIAVVPRLVTYEVQIVVNLTNPSSAAVANGILRGFAGSVFMASRRPSSMNVSFQVKLNNLRITNVGTPGSTSDPETGTIESPVFLTFGPPVDQPDRRYELLVSIILKDGSTVEKTYDITDQIIPVIEEIKKNLEADIPIQIKLDIPINISLDLPVIKGGGGEGSGGIGVGDWGEDEIIKFPVFK